MSPGVETRTANQDPAPQMPTVPQGHSWGTRQSEIFVCRGKGEFCGRREGEMTPGPVFSSFQSHLVGKSSSSLPPLPPEQSTMGISWMQARLKHSFSTSHLQTFGAAYSFVMEGCPVHCRVSDRTLKYQGNPYPFVTITNVSRH